MRLPRSATSRSLSSGRTRQSGSPSLPRARLHRLRDPSGGAPAVELMLPSAEGLPALPRGAEPPLYSIRERLTELQELLEQLHGDSVVATGAHVVAF